MKLRTLDERQNQSEPIQAFAAWSREHGRKIESVVDGRSMTPTLPAGTRIAIEFRRDPQVGSIVALLSGETVIAHRLIARCSGRSADYFLACGDGNLIPDPPVERKLILGEVSLVEGGEIPPLRRPAMQRLLAASLARLILLSAAIDVRLARGITRNLARLRALQGKPTP